MNTRRSRTIRLVLMGTVGLVGTLPLASCDSPPEADAFRTAEECISKTGQDLMCREAAQEAQAQAAQSAPAFRSQAACEAAFGNCGPSRALPSRDQADAAAQLGDAPPAAAASSGGGNWFVPAAAGFLLGRALGSPPAPFFQSRQHGAVGFGQQGSRLPIDPRAFADPRQREEQQRAFGSSGGGGGTSSSSRTTYSSARDSRPTRTYTSSPSRSGGFGTTARSSSSSSGG
jgi:uncharacterized protein YgiB involved in biofilm formation